MLLLSESEDEFEKTRQAFIDELQPEGPVEAHYVNNVAYHAWEILRYRHAKAEMTNAAERQALQSLLGSTLMAGGENIGLKRLLSARFEDDEARLEIEKMLQSHGFDKTTVAVEALRLRADDIERCDRLEALAEGRFEKDLRILSSLRGKLGSRLRRFSQQILDKGSPSIAVQDPEAVD